MARRTRGLQCLAVMTWVGLQLACVRVQVATEFEPDVDFSRYRTYAHARSPELDTQVPEDAPLVADRIWEAIDEALQDRDFVRVGAPEADLMVGFDARGHSTARLENAGDPDTDFYKIENYLVGEITIEIFDRRSGRRVWKGHGETGEVKMTYRDWLAARAVRKVMADFPPEQQGE